MHDNKNAIVEAQIVDQILSSEALKEIKNKREEQVNDGQEIGEYFMITRTIKL